MNIVIVGCGKIGRTLVSRLTKEGHGVVVIDNNPATVDEISNIFDVMVVFGLGTDYTTLKEAGTSKADIFVAVTGSDELNMLSCFMAKAMGAKYTVARIRNPEYNDKSLSFMQQLIDLTLPINPEKLTAQDAFNSLQIPSAINIEKFSSQEFEMIELKIKDTSPLSGQRILDLKKKFRANFLICVVQRKENVYIPNGNFVIETGDKIGISASPVELGKLLKDIGLAQKQARNVMILGASKTAYYLSKMLISSGCSVKIIDKDPKRCKEICKALPSATVILGDGAEQELLLEEGLANVDAFVSLTGMDEENILISYFASSYNIPKIITKVNRTEFISMTERLGLETIISPWKTVSDIIVRYARALQNSQGSNVERLYKIMSDDVEALEFNVHKDFKYINVPLKDINFKPNTLIAGIIRNRKAIIPSGDDCILPNDNVIAIVSGQRVYNLTDIVS